MLHTDESRKMTSYEWLCPVTKDWCMLKLTGKVLRNALWGGSLKTSAKYGYKAIIVIVHRVARH